jgi:hypothetical protein
MPDPNDRFDVLLEAMLTKPEPSAEHAPENEGDLDEGSDDRDGD